MTTPRRTFLKSAALTAVGAAFVAGSSRLGFGQRRSRPVGTTPGIPDGTPGFPIPIEAQKGFIYYSSYSTFAPYINSIFTARAANGEIMEMKLVSVTQYAPQANTKISTRASYYYTDCCSLMFLAPATLPTFASISSLRHAALGRLDLFLTPHGEDAAGFYYEAVINHITSTPPAEFM